MLSEYHPASPILGNDIAGVSPICCKHIAREVTGT